HRAPHPRRLFRIGICVGVRVGAGVGTGIGAGVAVSLVARLAARIDEIAEKVGIRTQQHARVVRPQAGLVGLHGTIEREEAGVLAVGFGEYLVALGIAVAARLFRLGLRLGDQHGHVTVRPRANLLRALAALGARLRGDALTFGLHALVDRLAVLLGQIG